MRSYGLMLICWYALSCVGSFARMLVRSHALMLVWRVRLCVWPACTIQSISRAVWLKHCGFRSLWSASTRIRNTMASVEDRLGELACVHVGVGAKRLYKLLKDEGWAINQVRTRKLLQALRGEECGGSAAGSHHPQCGSEAATATGEQDGGSSSSSFLPQSSPAAVSGIGGGASGSLRASIPVQNLHLVPSTPPSPVNELVEACCMESHESVMRRRPSTDGQCYNVRVHWVLIVASLSLTS